jgi:hypothetical protein
MARRKRRSNTAAAAEEPAGPMTEVQRAAMAIRKRAVRHAKLAELDAGIPPAEQLAKGSFRTVKIKDPDAPEPRYVRRNLSTRNLERWFAASKIDERQFQAGDRYRSDWERAGFSQRVTAKYGIVSTGGGDGSYMPAMPGTLTQMDAWRAWRAARADLGSLAEGFDAMAVHDQLATEIDPALDRVGIWTRRTSMMAVTICLDRLVVFYRL